VAVVVETEVVIEETEVAKVVITFLYNYLGFHYYGHYG
jgi:hypothetical protein